MHTARHAGLARRALGWCLIAGIAAVFVAAACRRRLAGGGRRDRAPA
ncbi:MAG: hypothetical protein AB7Q97_24625 [Gammaproteobacteria bacterium]